MSPRWAQVAGYGLYFYFNEAHQRPHVDVRRSGGRDRAIIDLQTGEVLAGTLPPGVLRQVRELLAQHREQAVEAFNEALAGRTPRKLVQEGTEGEK